MKEGGSERQGLQKTGNWDKFLRSLEAPKPQQSTLSFALPTSTAVCREEKPAAKPQRGQEDERATPAHMTAADIMDSLADEMTSNSSSTQAEGLELFYLEHSTDLAVR
jgi:hypothetical protein